ncbi:MAG: hypothetical protein MZW92_54090 [Comamonadaceae bacterium]|nr:hypothetical protein [Comamonadaceae bacterium]
MSPHGAGVPRPAVVHEGRPALRRPHHHREPDLRARDPARPSFGCGLDGAAARARAGAGAASSTASTTDGVEPGHRRRTSPPRYDADRLAGKAQLQGARCSANSACEPTPRRCWSAWSAG